MRVLQESLQKLRWRVGERSLTQSTERRDTCFCSFGIQGEYPTRILPVLRPLAEALPGRKDAGFFNRTQLWLKQILERI